MHVHSFLEVIPFMIMVMVIILKWPLFLDLVSLNWGAKFALRIKINPLDSGYILAYFLLMVFLGFLPYAEEMFRCWRHRGERAS